MLCRCNDGGFSWMEQDGLLRHHCTPPEYEGGRIEVIDASSGRVTRLYARCGDSRLLGATDIVLDAHGGFWFTDLGKVRLMPPP